ncbi:MAG TPA: ABC transporter ATP-binding protein [Candidatus Borkfalkia faecigallinarum]|uniref:ABC transporter ATP-binding protein n=1 Tax=Candidatus Borkfalkia faecigallinarum TaxID=2838509 RepID=A0A9D2ARV2_9FIRM|nr:ABC transporter ATP-binding protein [Candidatus Borkfalkia faecigallinarum]
MSDNIRIQNLTKRFEGFALEGVTFAVPRGAVVGFIGENGAGKSTTIKSILGLIRPDGGSIEVFGKDVGSLTKEERGRIGAVLGDGKLPENLTAKDLDGVFRHIFARWDAAAFFAYLDRFALPRGKKIKDFSRGMRQKFALAVALSHGADVLVLDEPTAGLDPVARDEILDILYDFMQDERRSVLISSHIVSDLEKLCDYIAFIHRGRLVFFEEKDALYEKYAVLRAPLETLRSCADAVVAVHRGEFGAGALVLRAKLPAGIPAERAGIEDIMLYFARGEKL